MNRDVNTLLDALLRSTDVLVVVLWVGVPLMLIAFLLRVHVFGGH